MANKSSALHQRKPHGLREMYLFLRNEVLELNARWIVFKQLFAQGEARIALFNREVPVFFSMVHDSMRDGIFISITRLTDKSKVGGKDTLSLRQLVAHPELASDTSATANSEGLLDKIEREREAIKAWRNRSGVHNDLYTAIDPEIHPLPPIMFDSVGIVLRLAADLLNVVGNHLNEPPTDFESITMFGDGDTIVSCVQKAKEHRLCAVRNPRSGD
jgi:hypothetical protein